jgi:beta-galactosidase
MIPPLFFSLRSFLLGSCLVVSLLQAEVSRPWSPEGILVGVTYNIFHSEFETDEAFYEQVDRDLAGIKAANIAQVMLFPMSQWNAETKELDFVRTDYVVKKIEELGLKFIPLMLKEEQCSHYFPIWKHREIESIWNQHYAEDEQRNNRQNVDFLDPKVWPVLEAYFKAVVERYRGSEALSFYNVWNEPHYDHNGPHVMARYHLWLKKKYGDLSTLRRIWGEDYSDWDQVTPFVNDDWDSSMPAMDWVQFKNELKGEILGELAELLRSFDPTRAVNSNPVNTNWLLFGGFGHYRTDNWVFTPYQDLNGMSYYPEVWDRDHPGETHPQWRHDLAFNVARCASGDKDYILTEVFTNAKTGMTLWGWMGEGETRRLAWTALANDCKGLVYWKWLPFYRGRQSLGRGLCTIEGELAPRGEAIRELGAHMEKWGKLLGEARLAKPQVAVLLDMAGLLKLLEESVEPRSRYLMFESNAGVFRALDEANLTVDFVRTDLALNLDALLQYKALVLPAQLVMRRSIAGLLRQYVEAGGTVIADARTASIDELDFAYRKSPGAGLDELFGASRKDWTAFPGNHAVEWLATDLSKVSRVEGRWFREQLVPLEGTRVLGVYADDQSPAVLCRQWGEGRAILSGVSIGASIHDQEGGDMAVLLLDLLRSAGVESGIRWQSGSGEQVALRLHQHPTAGELLYVINASPKAVKGHVAFVELEAGAKPYDLLSEGMLPLRRQKAGWEMELSLEAYGVRVIALRGKPVLAVE